MSRPNKIWFRKDVGWWMVTIAGEKIRLAQGKKNRREAEQKFHEVIAGCSQAPESPTARVADIVEAFLAWTKIHRSSETNRNYVWYGQSFSESCGYDMPIVSGGERDQFDAGALSQDLPARVDAVQFRHDDIH
jgi:hypothetical protein